MKLTHLIEVMQDLAQELGEDAVSQTEVRLMTQTSYPLEAEIHGITTLAAMNEADGVDEDEPGDGIEDCTSIVYITEGSQIGYGRKVAWQTGEQL